MRVRLESGVVDWENEELLVALRDGRVTELTNVSFDYGKTWTTAAAAAKRIEQKAVGSEALSTFVPKGWDYYAAYGLWVSLFWGFGFAAPVALLAGLFCSHRGNSALEKFAAMSGAFLTGAAPLLVIGFVVRWSVRRSNRRGAGVATFCFVFAALSVVEMLVISRL